MNGHAKENRMTHSPYLLFNQSREQLRRIGARGGKTQARNRRARLQAQTQAQPHPGTVLPPLAQTAAQAIAVLDAQFPWLCGAEKPRAPRRPRRNWPSSISGSLAPHTPGIAIPAHIIP